MLPIFSPYINNERFFLIKKNAHEISSNKELLKRHLWRSNPCKYGLDCKQIETCYDSHFSCEYRPPLCLHLEFCENQKNCKFYHPHMGTIPEYMNYMGISFKYNTPEEWLCNTKKLKEELEKKMKEEKLFTRFCKHMKNDKMCMISRCTFAHSIDQLIIYGVDFDSVDEKVKFVEKNLWMKIEDFMLRPAWMNNSYLKCLKEQEEFLEKEREYEKTGIEYLSVDENDENDDNDENDENVNEKTIDDIDVMIKFSKIYDIFKWESLKKENGQTVWGDE